MKKKILAIVAVVTVVVICVLVISAVALHDKDASTVSVSDIVSPTETFSNDTVDYNLKGDTNYVEYSDYLFLVKGDGSVIDEEYLSLVVEAVNMLAVAYEAPVETRVVVLYPTTDSFSLLAYNQRTEFSIEDNSITDWQGYETVDSVADFIELMNEVQTR